MNRSLFYDVGARCAACSELAYRDCECVSSGAMTSQELAKPTRVFSEHKGKKMFV
jgi:hypothetical protein